MAQDKYDAVWLSHSSIGDYLKCPRAYFLRNVYRNERGKKINLVAPVLSLGVAVHEAVEDLKNYKAEERFKAKPIESVFEEAWKKFIGKAGGFKSTEEEAEMKARGIRMIENVKNNPGLLLKKTVTLKEGSNGMPPNFYLSEEENLILC
jgi:hypothetical protein